MTIEHHMEKDPNMEQDKNKEKLVLRCIDFRTEEDTISWLSAHGFEEGTYYLYASAGASGNPEGIVKAVRSRQPASLAAVDHQDCGFYKKNGDDSPQTHHHNLEIFGTTLHDQNPDINYEYHLLPVKDERHTCNATAIILGEPEMVKLARQKLKETGLSSNYDTIARPFELSVKDETIWDDLKISLSLHHPTEILLFEKDKANAKVLIEKIKEIAKGVKVEPIFLEEKVA